MNEMNAVKAYKGVGMEAIIASWYARNTRRESRHREMAERMAALIPAGSRVLEIAPGPGYFSIELARLGNYQITGLDISQSFVKMAQENAARAGVDIDFRQGNAADMPFADETFNFSICQSAFKNFSQPVQALKEMHRVLLPGGQAVIIDLRSDATLDEIERYIASMNTSAINRLVTRWTFKNMLLKNAYTIAEVESFVAQTPFRDCRVEKDEISFTLWLQK